VINKETSCNCFKWGLERVKGERRWGDLTNVQFMKRSICIFLKPMFNKSLSEIVTTNPSCTMNIRVTQVVEH
jgi:hypothetical protein